VRPVSQERPSERTRGRSSRSPSRGITRGRQEPSRRAKRSGGFWPTVGGFFGAIFSPHRPMVLLTIIVVLLAVTAAVITGGAIPRTIRKTDVAANSLVGHAGFAIAQVHLSGNVRTRANDVMATLGVKAGQSIFGINLNAARGRLLALPWVADAEIHRHYPDDITVRIAERVAYARWQTPNGVMLVERQGRVITSDDTAEFDKLPLLVGEGAPAHASGFIDAVARQRAILARVKAYQYQSGRRWNLLLDNGVVVKLPETGWEVQIRELERYIVDDGILETNIREIDLRPSSPFFFVVNRDGSTAKEKKPETGSAI
jgi:cell division protein FtsQ